MGAEMHDDGDSQPALCMPPNNAFWCQYAMRRIAVARGYALPIDRLRRMCRAKPPGAVWRDSAKSSERAPGGGINAGEVSVRQRGSLQRGLQQLPVEPARRLAGNCVL